MTDNRELPPSERAELAEANKKKAAEIAQARESMIREDFGRTFQTEHGKRVLAYIMQRSGFGRVILSADSTQKVDPMATTFAAMELNFYLDIRRHIPVDTLQQIEYGFIKPSGTIEDEDAVKPKKKKGK